jgi:hypothetical protein
MHPKSYPKRLIVFLFLAELTPFFFTLPSFALDLMAEKLDPIKLVSDEEET